MFTNKEATALTGKVKCKTIRQRQQVEVKLRRRKKLCEALTALESKCDFIIIDCPGGLSNYVKMAHTVADTLVTPMNDSLIDFDLLAQNRW